MCQHVHIRSIATKQATQLRNVPQSPTRAGAVNAERESATQGGSAELFSVRGAHVAELNGQNDDAEDASVVRRPAQQRPVSVCVLAHVCERGGRGHKDLQRDEQLQQQQACAQTDEAMLRYRPAQA